MISGRDVVYSTSEEASTWRQAMAAERSTRERALEVAQAINCGDEQRMDCRNLPVATRSVVVGARAEVVRPGHRLLESQAADE